MKSLRPQNRFARAFSKVILSLILLSAFLAADLPAQQSKIDYATAKEIGKLFGRRSTDRWLCSNFKIEHGVIADWHFSFRDYATHIKAIDPGEVPETVKAAWFKYTQAVQDWANAKSADETQLDFTPVAPKKPMLARELENVIYRVEPAELRGAFNDLQKAAADLVGDEVYNVRF
jgi:hypothetical protein